MLTDSEYDPKTENRAAIFLAAYILYFVIVSALLLAINTWMIYSLAQGTSKLLPDVYAVTLLVQLLIFVGPMVLLYLEWFAWDVVYAQRSQRRKKRKPN